MTRASGCRRCESTYVSDSTPMGKAGHCMMCRPFIEVTCDRCGAACPGAYDGQRKCAGCRSVPLGLQQYEDKQAAAIAAQQRGSRVLITGSRTWTNRVIIRDALTTVWRPDAVLVSGACPRGADPLCEQCWRCWGGEVEQHAADWDRHGSRAGFVRNDEMVSAGADVCLAFIRAGSPGASHCARQAKLAGIPTRVYTTD